MLEQMKNPLYIPGTKDTMTTGTKKPNLKW